MNKLIYFILTISIFSCSNIDQNAVEIINDSISQQQIDSILTEFKFEYDDLIFVDSSSQVLLPITTRLNTRSKSYGKDGNLSDEYARFWNIIFYNSSSYQTRLLTESKIRIEDLSVNIQNAGQIIKNSILYIIGDIDYNADTKIDYQDPVHLFISEIDGTKLKRISPENENLKSYKIVPNTDKIIYQTIRDIDNNLVFDRFDEQIWYMIDLGKNEKSLEIVDSLDRKKIENLYFEQWLKK